MSVKYKKKYYKCTVCNSDNYLVLYKPWADESNPIKLYGAASGIPGTQRIVQCTVCGMIYENPRYDEQVIVNGYMNSQEGGHDSQFQMRINSFYKTLIKLKHLLPGGTAKVLDIGTAGGGFLDAAVRFGYDAYGLEPSSDLVSRGKARGLKIEQGTIDMHSFEQNMFDLVCLWDVIEHLPDPKSSLIEIKKLLKPEGVLLINYPDIGTLQAKIAGKHFWWILSVHLHHFTRKSISEICGRTGFDVFHFQRYWQTLEFGYLEKMAEHYKIPLSGLFRKVTPEFIKRIPIPYYASQTTVLARVSK